MNWVICFKKAKNIGLWKLFTSRRPDFGHVFAVHYSVDLDSWFKFEYSTQRFHFDCYRGEDADYLIHDLVENCTCISIDHLHSFSYLPRWLYCVSFVKHMVGISKPWILTPYQLYCELINSGGEVIFTKEGD